MLRTSVIFSTIDTVLVTDQVQTLDLHNLKIKTIRYKTSNLTAREHRLLETKSNGLAFRSGYWRWTTERILALKFAQKNLNDSILHVESDVMLLRSFPMQSMNEIAQQKQLMWCAHRPHEDVASLLYSRDLKGIDWLYKCLLREISESQTYTDMSLLSKIRNKYPNKVAVFPFLTTSNECKSNEFAKPKEIFDPLAIGIWLFGQDPRNNYGMSIRRDLLHMRITNPYMNPSHFDSFSFKKPETIKVHYQGYEIPVHSLHVHSKEIEAFKKTEEVLSELILGISSQLVISKWNIKLTISLLRDNHNSKTLKIYIKHFIERLFEIVIQKVKNKKNKI